MPLRSLIIRASIVLGLAAPWVSLGAKQQATPLAQQQVTPLISVEMKDQWLTGSFVSQFIFGGNATIAAALNQGEQYPDHAYLGVSIASKNAPPFVADDMRFFVLDGTGQQLRHVSLDEIKYAIQLTVAQNRKGWNYPPPPPPSPQRQYTISGVENGNYTVTNLGGGMGSVTGTSTSAYTVTQQPDYYQLGQSLGYSLGLAVRKSRHEKADKKLF